MNSTEFLNEAIIKWSNTYNVAYQEECMPLYVGTRGEIEGQLIHLFENHGYINDIEAGDPDGYIPEVITEALKLLEALDWEIDDVSFSFDEEDELVASVLLKNSNGKKYNMKISDVDSDYISGDLFYELEQFSKLHCSKRLVVFVDESFRMLGMIPAAAKEIETIINKVSIPELLY